MTKITENFRLQEFESKCGSGTPPNVLTNIIEVAKELQVLRNQLNKPITVTSGYRSPKHNAKVKGAKNSQHLTGKAVDIKVNGMTPIQVFNEIENLISQGKMRQGGLGLYPNWVHYDIRGTKARW